MIADICLLRTERPKKPEICRMEARRTGNQRTYLEVKRSNVKVTRPINAVITDNAPYAGWGNYNFLKIRLLNFELSLQKKDCVVFCGHKTCHRL